MTDVPFALLGRVVSRGIIFRPDGCSTVLPPELPFSEFGQALWVGRTAVLLLCQPERVQRLVSTCRCSLAVRRTWLGSTVVGSRACTVLPNFRWFLLGHDVLAAEERGGGESGCCAARTCTHAPG